MKYKINGFYLDEQQTKIVEDKSKHIIVVAGAGSGKTLTILGKINYLISYQNIDPNQILCLSFTKAASNSLKDKIRKEFGIDMNVFTFHKLALNILKGKYEIADVNLLNDIIDEYFRVDLIDNKKIYKLLKVKNKKQYLKKINSNEIKNIKRLIITFIHLFKCYNYKIEDFIEFKKKAKTLFNLKYFEEKKLLIIIINAYLKYQKYLYENNEIDFDDMIIKATNEVKMKYNSDIRYIIIDEYQDTSYIRFNLIKTILEKTKANLMVVGDDFQSIYRFTGCDINIFLNFTTYFKDSKIMKIENTYRNSSELIKMAGSFIMKNKQQIKKNLRSLKHIDDPIEIYCYKNKRNALKKILDKKDFSKAELLILGRNNDDINQYIDKEFKVIKDKFIYKNIDFKYMTVHKSKGLESDNVIILNMEDSLLGFPSKIKDEKILRFVTKYDKYPYAEERRLFYVALTRTKNKVYILSSLKNKSEFVKELIKDYKIKYYVL